MTKSAIEKKKEPEFRENHKDFVKIIKKERTRIS